MALCHDGSQEASSRDYGSSMLIACSSFGNVRSASPGTAAGPRMLSIL
jgi:hypothetical protein